MRKVIPIAMLTAALAAPAFAASYPVSGRWGQSVSDKKGAIECQGRRVMSFSGNQRTDSGGGVPAYRNRSVTDVGSGQYRIVDIFSNGQVSSGQSSYTLHKVDADHITLQSQQGTLKLQRCK
jgi:hypothetical protein